MMVCFFVIIILLFPVSIASNVEIKINTNIREKTNREQSDYDSELISFITGSCKRTNIKGFINNKPIEIYSGDFALYLQGIRKSNEFFEFLYKAQATHVNAIHFIGVIFEVQPNYFYWIYGIIIGEIDWY